MALEAVTLLAPLPTALGAADCTDRFPEGRYGIPPSHSAIAFVKPALDGFSPLYVEKLPVAITTAADCEYVDTGDVFRLAESPAALFAGCIGDFNGDGQPEMALLMKRPNGVFESEGGRQGNRRGRSVHYRVAHVLLERGCQPLRFHPHE